MTASRCVQTPEPCTNQKPLDIFLEREHTALMKKTFKEVNSERYRWYLLFYSWKAFTQ